MKKPKAGSLLKAASRLLQCMALLLAFFLLFSTALESCLTRGVNRWEFTSDTRQLGNYLYTRNVCYGEEYPNSVLDIATALETDSSRPTAIFVHGGGFIGVTHALYEWDDWGKELNAPYTELIDDGYNVVSIQYAFAPEYTYPTPVLQLDRAIAFLQENAGELGLNMDRIVLIGASAGGHIITEYACACTNEELAEELGLTDPENRPEIAALALQCALLVPADCTRTGMLTHDLIFGEMVREYFPDHRSKKAGDLTRYITGDFPPVWMDEGSRGSFLIQAEKLKSALDAAGVKNCLYVAEGKTHGFDYGNSKEAKECRKEMIEFLDSYCNDVIE